MKKKSILRRLIPWLIALAAIAALILFVFVPIYSEKEVTSSREQRLVFAEEPGEPVVIENGDLAFEMDPGTTWFTVTSKRNGKVWYSNPQGRDKDPIARGVNSELLSSTLNLTYMSGGGEVELNSYRYSIANRNFEILRVDDSTVRVNYAIGKIEREYLIPDAITEENFNALIGGLGALDKKKIKAFYTLMDAKALSKASNRDELIEMYDGIETTPMYLLKAETTPENKEKVEGYLQKAGYTQEDYERDQKLLLKKTEKATFYFNASVIYRLEGNDLVVEVPYSEITCDPDHPLIYVSVLPMFGAAGTDQEGFILLPEGSGALIRYNNGKISQPNYYANFYGWDYGMERTEAVSETENAFCVFGMSQENGSFICMIEDASSFGGIYADISERSNSYNYVYSKYNLIHYGRFKLSGRTNELIPMYETEIPDATIVQRYRFLEETEYPDMAEAYGNYLRSRPEFAGETAGPDVPVNVELVGAINKTIPKLGFPVDSVVAVTTFDQAGEILKELKNAGVAGLSVRMTGWSNGGVRQKALSLIRIQKELGGTRGMNNLIETARSENVPLYFDGISCFAYHSGLLERFIPFLHAAKFTTRELIQLYPYDIVTYQQATWNESESFYLVKPRVASGYADRLIRTLADKNAAGVAFRDIGNLLSADYNKKDTVTREQVKAMNVETLKKAKDLGLKISIKEGNDYALPYADLVTDINLSGSGYALLDQSIPFLEIAIHGMKNYTGEAVNLAGDYQNVFLECAEYGAGLNFTFMKKDTDVLLDSAYSCYTGAAYDRWKEDLVPLILRYQTEMAGLNSQRMTGHTELTRDLHRTEYEDGTRVYVNYGHSDAEAEGLTIPARDYLVERGDAE